MTAPLPPQNALNAPRCSSSSARSTSTSRSATSGPATWASATAGTEAIKASNTADNASVTARVIEGDRAGRVGQANRSLAAHPVAVVEFRDLAAVDEARPAGDPGERLRAEGHSRGNGPRHGKIEQEQAPVATLLHESGSALRVERLESDGGRDDRDVGLHELEADPVGAAQRVYDAAGLTLEGAPPGRQQPAPRIPPNRATRPAGRAHFVHES